MPFTVTIHTDNAAFHDDDDDRGYNPAPELARILRGIAERVELEGLSGYFETIHDANGNDVGRYALKTDADDAS